MRVGEGVEYVSCKLCHRRLKTLNNRHLVRIHGFPSDKPVVAYRRAHPRAPTWCLETSRALSTALVRYRRQTRRVWTMHEVTEKIQKLHRAGKALGPRSIAGIYPAFYGAALRLFGSWARALGRAGVDPTRIRQYRRWTPGELIRAIRARGRRGGSLAYRTVDLEDTGLLKAAVRVFGTWDKAVRAAGLSVDRTRGNRAWDPDLILGAIRKGVRSQTPGKLRLRQKGLFAIASRYFGGWRIALEAAGVIPRIRWHAPRWSPRKVISEIRGHVEGGSSLAWKAVFRKKPELIGAALEAFGSWRAAITTAGYRVSRPMTRQEWTRPALRKLLIDIQKRHGTVTPELLLRERPEGYASPAIHAALLFGSLEKAVREILPKERGEGQFDQSPGGKLRSILPLKEMGKGPGRKDDEE